MMDTKTSATLRHFLAGMFLLAFAALAQLDRQPNATLQIPQEPGGFGYEFTDALNLQFEAPVALVTPPGETNRLFVVELPGRVTVVTNLSAPTKTVFLDLVSTTVFGEEQGLLALAFHPDFAANGRFFVYRVTKGVVERETRLSEFRVSAEDPNAANPEETVILSQPVYGTTHYGGDLHFGPDGYLYGSIGDGGVTETNAQSVIGAVFSGIYRIDVDSRPDSLPPNPHPDMVQNYRIPAGNPFVGINSFLNRLVNPNAVRTEFWAVGLRNPFRFSFDPLTGELWLGDVGEESYESIFVSRRGANHGWAFLEGTMPGKLFDRMPADFLSNPAHSYVPPVHSYNHDIGHSALGGLVYRGRALSQLHGLYVFADHSWGHVSALAPQSDGTLKPFGLTWKPYITDFAYDPRDGEILVTELTDGRVWRLTYTTNFTGQPLPPTLADTGAFTDLESLQPAPGIVPYTINQPFWSDDAIKRRWFCLPETNQTVAFATNDTWAAPAGAVWIKHFDLELTNGVPESRRRLETRFLVRNARGVYGVTYRWDSPTNATLVPEEGADELLPRERNGQAFTQKWRYPARSECLVCHTPQAGLALGFNTAQLNCQFDYGDVRTNQLSALAAAGYFATTPPRPRDLPALAHPTNLTFSLEWRARSYLAANCSSCHRPGGTALGSWDARLQTPTALAGLIDGPLKNLRGDEANRVIAPGDPTHSVLLQRISTRGFGQMPPLASSISDPVGVDLLRRWINSVPTKPLPETPALATIEPAADGLRLQIWQPPNRRLRLEAATSLDAPAWQPVELPESMVNYPAEPQTLVLEPTIADQNLFFRVLSYGP